ncbi:hypothetical protein LVD15_15245 [Fulvivirga maritima]|uniref:hypothetical protein n=1 Tax=Fulvivirga maritima TaxID=2904247 RepID=UPI001F21FD7B|nr:hypothetical protein [Fulvivirga maritima]UII24669.1 hypothetical protein LVD15_15245 [Fulvivirga maritima]
MYKVLFELAIDHQYFSAGRADIAIVPDEKTDRMMRGQHFLMKNTFNGIRVLTPVYDNGDMKPILTKQDHFAFNLYPTSSIFSQVTELPKAEPDKVILYNNSRIEDEALFLTTTDHSASTFNGYPLVARVEIGVTDQLLAGVEEVHKVVFNAPAIKWKYYFISEDSAQDLSIEDGSNMLVFNQVDITEQADDPLLMSLKKTFPDLSLSLFESDSPVVASNYAVKKLGLLRGGEVIIKHLPNPGVDDGGVKIIKTIQVNK